MATQPVTPDEEFDALSKLVATLAFNQQKKVGELLREMHCLYHTPKYARYRPFLKMIRGWLVVPFSLWPRDMIGLGKFLSAQLRAGNPLSPRFVLVMRLLREYPPEAAQLLVAMHEHDVQKGKYDGWTRKNKKFLAYEKRIQNNPELLKEWELIKEELISLASSADAGFRKTLILSAASYFEAQVRECLIELVSERTNGDECLIAFVKNKAIERQYHTYFDWKDNKANRFFALFGPGFRDFMVERVQNNGDIANAVKAFLEIGELRNLLVHQNFASYPLDKTVPEIFDLYQIAHRFVSSLPSHFSDYKTTMEKR